MDGLLDDARDVPVLAFIRQLRACLERRDWTIADYDAALAAQAQLGLTDADLPESVLTVVQDVRDMLVAMKRDMARIDARFGPAE